jgi:hypothetical protein
MIKSEELHKTIKDLNKSRQHTFAEFIDELFHGKFIEIYLGDSYEQVSTEQISVSYPAVFCGKVEGAYREVLVINSAFIDKKTKTMKLGNMVFINERAIRALNEVDNVGSLDELFLKSSETIKILDTLEK